MCHSARWGLTAEPLKEGSGRDVKVTAEPLREGSRCGAGVTAEPLGGEQMRRCTLGHGCAAKVGRSVRASVQRMGDTAEP